MKKKIALLLSALTLVIVFILFAVFSNQARFIESEDPEIVAEALHLLRSSLRNYRRTYIDFRRERSLPYGTSTSYALPQAAHGLNPDQSLYLAHGDMAYFVLSVDQQGLYQLNLEYLVEITTHSPSIFRVRINDESQFMEMDTIAMRMVFYDETKDFPTNTFGDQSPPLTRRRATWQRDYFHDTTFSTATPFLFHLEAGENIIQLTNIAQSTYIGELTASPPVPIQTYAEYRASTPQTAPAQTQTISLSGADYTEKNSADVVLTSINSVRATPVHPDMRLINAVAINEPGTAPTYEIYISENGLYALGLYAITSRVDFETFITVRINGEIPFQEFKNFNLHGNQRFDDLNFQILYNRDTGDPFFVYLPAGVHTLSITLEREPVMDISHNLRLVIEHVSQFVLEAQRITGTGSVDTTRSWNFTRYMPEAVPFLEAYRVVLQDAVYRLQYRTDAGVNADMLAETMIVFNMLDRLLEFPDDLPLHMTNLSGSINSVSALAGRLFGRLNHTQLEIDTIMLSTDPAELVGSGATWWDAFVYGAREVGVTFTSDRFNNRLDDEYLNIWVAQRSIMEIDLLQNLTDTHFTPQTGIPVRISVMPDMNRLIMSAAANEVPDLGIGLPSWMPFDLASRNALHDMTEFPNFWEVAGQFPPGSMVSYAYLDGMFALPESLEFQVLIYRTDIFDTLELPIPDTWQDVLDILPELQRYGMNFGHPLSWGGALKFLNLTWPFYMQHGAELFTEDGIRPLIAEPDGVQSLRFMSDLFMRYSLPLEVPSFFDSFRRGELPIGIVTSGLYRGIRSGAREIQGLWDIAPLPGIQQEDGSVSRWFMANGHAAAMFRDSEKLDEAWEWLQWWLSAPVQVQYTQMMSSSFGELFFWFPSNPEAWHTVAMSHEHRMMVMDQMHWMREIQRVPGLYMVERAISNAWSSIVFQGVSPQRAADRASTIIHREVRRKMIEFGFLDDEGNVIREFVLRDIDWIIENIEAARGDQ